MPRSARNMAKKLIEIYERRKGRYLLTREDFKGVAGKIHLKQAYLDEVDTCLREDGYLLVDLSEEHGVLAVVRQSVILKYPKFSPELEDLEMFANDEEDEE